MTLVCITWAAVIIPEQNWSADGIYVRVFGTKAGNKILDLPLQENKLKGEDKDGKVKLSLSFCFN
jgi:hypothetical protein